MTDAFDPRDLERRLSISLHAAAPRPAPDLADRLLRQTAAIPQRRRWTVGFFGVLAAAVVIALAVVTGLGIANLLPGSPNIGDDPTAPPATVEVTPSATPDVSPSPSPSASLDPTAGWPECENEELGFTVRYPPDWWVQEAARPDPELDPLPGCTYFAREPVEIRQNAGLPPGIAIIAGFEELPVGNPEQPLRVISSRQTEVAGRPVVVDETEWTEDTVFLRAGDRSYAYLVSVPEGPRLVFGTSSTAGDYEANKAVLDAMMTTLELTGS
jgi:hypothetical protein